jgi:predicted SprT family Zn-dependent metalloprotease
LVRDRLKAQRKLSLAAGSWSFVTDKPKRCEHCRRKFAEVYAIDPIPNGWGGYYCADCCEKLRFVIVEWLAMARAPNRT